MVNLFRIANNLAFVNLYLPLIVVFGLILIAPFMQAYSELLPQNYYILEGKGFASTQNYIEDSKIKLNIFTNNQVNGVMPFLIKNGTISFSDTDYVVLGSWTSNILRDGRFVILSGNAQNPNGEKIHLNLFGKLVQDIQSGGIYQVNGKITASSESLKTLYSTKMSIVNIAVTQKTQTSQSPSINPSTTTTPSITENVTNNVILKKHNIEVIVFQTNPVYTQHNYVIEAKVFYTDQNPTRDFNQRTGFVPGVAITVQIFDSTGVLTKTLRGQTNAQGYYTDTFSITNDFKPGTYTTIITAQFENNSDSQKLTFVVRPFYS